MKRSRLFPEFRPSALFRAALSRIVAGWDFARKIGKHVDPGRVRAPRSPLPVPTRVYRYSRLRWRILVRAFDTIGGLGMRIWRWKRPTQVTSEPHRILVVQLDHLGDAVLSSPLFPRLRARYPDATIDVLASLSNHSVFEAEPRIDRVFVAERNWFERRPGAWALGSAVWRLGRRLRSEGYDLGIDVRGDILTVLVMTLAGIPRRVGWTMGGGGFLLTDVAEWIPNRHEVLSRLALIDRVTDAGEEPARVSVHVDDVERVRVAGWLSETWRERPMLRSRAGGIRERRKRDGNGEKRVALKAVRSEIRHASARSRDPVAEPPLLAVHLGAGTAAKRWPMASWRVLIGRFLDEGWRVIVVGSGDDAPAAKSLSPHANLRDWTGRLSVTETTALLERAELFIGADSGPAHLASCAGVTSVVLFSGTNQSAQWRPWSRRSLVLKHDVPCRPCHHKTCPLSDHPCMTGLTPDRVYHAAVRWSSRMNRGEPIHVPFR